MKKTMKLLFTALVIVIMVAMAVTSVSAAESAKRVDPTTLTPTSDRVIFIKDAPAGGKLSGDGSGYDADNPYIPLDHEGYNPADSAPQNHLQTAFYQATEVLGDDGGTIVICGPVHLGVNESYGSGGTTKDVFTYKWGTKKVIKFTSVYNGVDYRETAGAKITLETPAEIGVMGSSVWENITIETIGTERVISFGSHPTLIGEGVDTHPADPAYNEVAANYVSLSGGHRYARGDNQIPTLTVQSGTYNKVVGGLWGVSIGKEMTNATTYLTLEGTTTVLGAINGTIGKNTDFSGHANITINGGKYACDIFGVGPTGMTNTDGTVDLIINGGDFSEAWSICEAAPSMANNTPALSILDYSGYTGEKADLARAFAISLDFDTVKLPAGVTEAELIALAGDAMAPETTVPETKAPETVETQASTSVVDDESPADDENDKNNEGEKQDAVPDDSAEGSINLTLVLIIVIVAAVVVLGGLGVAIIVLLAKKKK